MINVRCLFKELMAVIELLVVDAEKACALNANHKK